MKKRKIFFGLFNTNGYYIWMLVLCSVALTLYDVYVGTISLAIAVICFLFNLMFGYSRRKNVRDFLRVLTDGFHSDIKEILGGNLIPLVIIGHDGTVLWSNDGFSKIIETNITKKAHISELIPEFDFYACLNTAPGTFYRTTHLGRTYTVEVSLSNNENEKLYAFHFKDCTEYEVLKQKYNDEKFVCATIVVDNYDDIMVDVTNADKPKVSAAIEETLNLWSQSVNGILKKYEKDKFTFYFSNEGLETFIKQRFDILEQVREIAAGNRLSPTLSIGVGSGGENMLQNETYAYNALDMALGRGGDQTIVKNGEKYTFFGGKTQETEKRTKVKARVVAEAIKQLLIENDDIIIMGHKNPDCDSFGAAIGLYRAVKSEGKSCKILMENHNDTVSKMIDTFSDIEYDNVIINKAYANEIVNKKTLVFVVDTHVKSMVEEPSLLDVSKNVIIIDHHRKNADFIQNPLISYHEPYASSASELVTEIIQYMGDKVRLTKKEAEALYAGIYLDTKNFTFKTGARTFEAASFLKKLGVDTITIKKLFQVDINTFTRKWEILRSATTYKQSISIAKCTEGDVGMRIIVAQAADELLNVTDVTCSFVLCDSGSSVFISARSLGTYNIQIIMEKLGGGGHTTSAAVDLKGVNMDKAEKMLKKAIDEYLNEI